MIMIRIAKIPFIQEDTDRWGRLLGTFSVVDIQGEIYEHLWAQIQEFEGYYLSEGAKSDEAIMKSYISDSIVLGNLITDQLPTLPHMAKVIGYAKSLMWQFNLRTKKISEEEFEYMRSYAVFGEITLHAWSPEHDKRVEFLKQQVMEMNSKLK